MYSTLIDLHRARRRPDWKDWKTLTATSPPFLAPEFFALTARFTTDAPLIAEAWDDKQTLIGALPLVRSGDRLRNLRSDYSPGYDYTGTQQGIEVIWAALRDDQSWNELELAKIPADSLLATRLPALATADGYPIAIQQDSQHPFFALPGFEARLSPKFRSNLQRCERKAGGIELERIAIPDRAAFDEALAIEAMAWKGAAGTAIETDSKATHLYRVLSRLLGRRGLGAVYFLCTGGRRIATLFAVEDGRTLYALKIGYDPAVSNLSPGHLLVWKVAADAEARGLQTLDFVGHEDEWKRKWTNLVHPHVKLTIYRNNAAGLARYALRHVIRPHLPTPLRGDIHDVLPRGCQRSDIIGVHTLIARVRGRVDQGLGIKSAVKSALKTQRTTPIDPVGAPSQFASGAWVRVKSADEMRGLLDEHDRTRGLLFTQAQWDSCGSVFRVDRPVRRLRNDHGRFRPISRTVLLEGSDCAGRAKEPAGCGRHCPMMYRDEWLEPASPPAPVGATRPASHRYARVRSLDEIRAGLDLLGRRDGLTFMPEMAQFAGKRFAIANEISTVFEYDRWTKTRGAIYLLEGLHCSGKVVGDRGPCDRACTLMWHADWLIVEA